MKKPEPNFEDAYHDWLIDSIYTDAAFTGVDLEDETEIVPIVKALRDVANELEKPFMPERLKTNSSNEEYDPNDPKNW
jgi:hypothetical protein